MIGLTLIFHIFAGLSFLVLGYVFVRQRVKLEWSQRFWSIAAAKMETAFVLDWPYHFLMRLCDTIGVEMQGPSEGASKGSKAIKILIYPWIDLHLNCGIQGLHWRPGEPAVLEVSLRDITKNSSQEWQAQLQASLGHQLEVQVLCAKHD